MEQVTNYFDEQGHPTTEDNYFTKVVSYGVETYPCYFKATYDKQGNLLIHETNSYKEERTYDDRGNVLTYEDSDGIKFRCTFNERNQELIRENDDGIICERIYDEQGRPSSIKTKEFTKTFTYTDSGIIYETKLPSDVVTVEVFDNNNNKLKVILDGTVMWEKTYDQNNNVLTYKDSTGKSWEKTYDQNNNVLTTIVHK